MRFSFVYLMAKVFIAISFFTRLLLLGASFSSINIVNIELIKIFGVGLFYDIIASFYYFIPLTIYLAIIPNNIFNSSLHKKFLYLISTMIIFTTIFNSVSEYFFWEEFGKRFNFIAVDYLIYTHEVINNIKQSYPIPTILSVIAVVSMLITYKLKDAIDTLYDDRKFIQRLQTVAILSLFPFLSFNILDKQTYTNISNNIYNNELSKNGIYSLFSAFRHNELDYYEFYKTLDNQEVFNNLKKLETFDNRTSKIVTAKSKEKRYNIMLIMVESLSAEYMGIFGDKRGLTPNLDKIAKNSLFFNNLFATGTRTVRGMEAVNLSIPPTPGRSIVKRPKNDNLDSIGKILKRKGYINKFIYAGHGYFDNMNDFFSKNGFYIVDRTDFDKEDITFANVWGVCDEDLFNKVLKESDISYKNNKPFFNFIMTTSNHRPYTYPEGKVDIPSHTSRAGAVKYTDYAINKFIHNARQKPWFKDTIFVILADHNGGSAGKSSLPLYRYKIPLLVYAPDIIKPQINSKLSSQIDTMPTIFALMGLNYKAKFYGNNILNDNFKQRAFIGNYQKLGYVKDNSVYYLTSDKKSHKLKIDKLGLYSVRYKDKKITKEEEKEIVTYYQSASYLYKEK